MLNSHSKYSDIAQGRVPTNFLEQLKFPSNLLKTASRDSRSRVVFLNIFSQTVVHILQSIIELIDKYFPL